MDKFELIDRFREKADAVGAEPDVLALPRWSADNWYQLAAATEPCEIAPGEALITTGNSERSLFLIVSGGVEVAYVVRQSLSVSVMSHVGAGSVVGEQAFFDSAPRSANVWAVDHSQMLKLELRAMERFADSNPRLGYELVFALGRILAHRLRATTAKAAA